MSREVSLSLIGVALLALIFSITNGFSPKVEKPAIRVEIVKSQPVLTDKQKVTKFVNELMIKRQANCLLWVFEKESHINPKSANSRSSAKGVGQLLESTYRTIGLKHSADPLAQVVASIAYISRHYGSDGACAAKAFWQKHSYY
jgi:hypothetical protein